MTIALEWLRKVYDKAPHNAFTDLNRFRDRFFLTFRVGTEHASFDGQIEAMLSTPDDDRDSHFAIFRGRLLVYFASRIRRPPAQRTMCSSSPDGKSFTKPRRVFQEGHWLWRPKPLGESLFCASYEVRNGWRSSLLRSEDGIQWEEASTETELLPLPYGALLALVRREAPPKTALLCRSEPPFSQWEKQDTGLVLQGPAMTFWGGEIVLCARFFDRGRPYTGLFRLELEKDLSRGKILHLFTLPSGGDTSYAGLFPLDEQRLLISYYSSHEGRSSIYLALLRRL